MVVLAVFSVFAFAGAVLTIVVASGDLCRAEVLQIIEALAVIAIIFLAICWLLGGRQGQLEHELLASLFFLLAALALCASLRRSRP